MVVLDPIGSLIQAGNQRDAHVMLIRLIDFLKKGCNRLPDQLDFGGEALEKTDVEISSMVDTWLFVRDLEFDGERNRALYVLKSRGMTHSNQLREFLLTGQGVDLLDVTLARKACLPDHPDCRRKRARRPRTGAPAGSRTPSERETRKREALEARIGARNEFETEEDEVETAVRRKRRGKHYGDTREAMVRSRQADARKMIRRRNPKESQ